MSTPLIGAAGEYYTAAEVSRYGWAASITPRNVDRTDVLPQDIQTGAVVGIQVKTSGGAQHFQLSVKDESPALTAAEWFVCVRLSAELERPDFYVVPRDVVSALIYLDHRHFLAMPGRSGQPHKDNAQRVLRAADITIWRDSWQALEHDPYARLPIWAYAAFEAYGLPDGHPLTPLFEGPIDEKVPASTRDGRILAQISELWPDVGRRFARPLAVDP